MQSWKKKIWRLTGLGVVLVTGLQAQIPYSDVASLNGFLDDLVKSHSRWSEKRSLGKTLGGNDIWEISIGAKPLDEKPAIWIVAGLDGRYHSGVQYALWLIQDVLGELKKPDSQWAGLMQNHTLYVIPCANPDAILEPPEGPVWERSTNFRETDDDRDGQLNEDEFDDLNGDGLITQMRVFRKGGEFTVFEKDSLLWRKADVAKGEEGQFDLYSEGIDTDRDKNWNEDPPGGVNPNYNFTFQYPYFKAGAGPFQVSEVESRAIADFGFAHPNIVMVFTFTADDNLLHPWETEKKRPERQDSGERSRFSSRKEILAVPQADEPYFARLRLAFEKRFRDIQKSPAVEHPGGSFARWAYFHYGRWTVAAPGWILPADSSAENKTQPGAKRDSQSRARNMKGAPEEDNWPGYYHRLITFADKHDWPLFVAWRGVQHPDFKNQKVEVGGFRPYALWNPPLTVLEEYRVPYLQYLSDAMDLLPRLWVSQPEVEALSAGVYRVRLQVKNTGSLATNSVLGDTLRWVQNVRIMVKSNAVELVSGKKIDLIPPLKPGETAERSLVLRSSHGQKLELEIGSPVLGYQTKTVSLK